MGIIKDCTINNQLNQTESKNSIQQNLNKNSKINDYFDYIYSYPPKIKIKWDAMDELKEDLFIRSNYGVLERSFPFIDYLEDWLFNSIEQEAVNENYSISKYKDGFLDKVNSSNFFLKKTKEIQTSLANIPVFVIVNGSGEIVLSKPSNVLGSKGLFNYTKEKIYDFCGAFDQLIEKKSELGLFFMNQVDAEKQLKEIAICDFEGTQTVGLSIHCISLESAYKITREHHPGIDFRFVPNFNETKELLIKNIGKSDMIVDDEQQQLRFRRRNNNLFPYLNKLGAYLSPSSSFLQRNEYFKGVPIYVVQLNKNPRNFLAEKYFNLVGTMDTVYSRCIQYLDNTLGFGHNWIMQGSFQKASNSDQHENYIFFEKEQAVKFSKKNGRKVVRYSGGRTSTLKSMIRKPKIFIYNLEDFIEDWEDNIIAGRSNYKTNHFISPINHSIDLEDLSNNKMTVLQNLSQFLEVKFRILKSSVGVFFSVN